jgi:predicted lipoprotein
MLMATKKRVLAAFMLLLACLLAITSCKIVKIEPAATANGGGAGNGSPGTGRSVISSGEKAVDASEYLAEHLETMILPEIEDRKTSLAALLEAADAGWDRAGALYGEKKGEIGAFFNFIAHDTVLVREVNTESRNGFMIVVIDGNPTEYTIRISIGPVLRGTAIRDSIKFIDFNHFVNQMDFAELANALNRYGNENVTSSVDLDSLVGKTVEFTGSFTQPESGEISIMPIFMEVKQHEY